VNGALRADAEEIRTCEFVCHSQVEEFQDGRRVEGGIRGGGKMHDWAGGGRGACGERTEGIGGE